MDKLVSRAAEIALLIVFTLVAAILAGCGGGGGAGSIGEITLDSDVRSTSQQPGVRSVQLNNYNNFRPFNTKSTDYGEKVQILVARDRICFTEGYEIETGLTPDAIRSLNPKAKVFRYFAFCGKGMWESDAAYGSPLVLINPIPYSEIVENDWWLRDGSGDYVLERGEDFRYLDVGKEGVKEAYLRYALERMNGKGYDGIVLDYWVPGLITRCITLQGKEPPAAYPTDNDWYEKAWKPFVEYVTNGLRRAGYTIIGNCASVYTSPDPMQVWQRGMVDGVIYEIWAFESSGVWAEGSDVDKRIRALREDPLEAWTADYPLKASDPNYRQKATLSLAMYYVGLPDSPSMRAKRFYHHSQDSQLYWDPMWDFYIGDPAEAPMRIDGRYAWSRKFTHGIVILNCESGDSVTVSLAGTYHDADGTSVAGTVTVPPHTALILASGQGS